MNNSDTPNPLTHLDGDGNARMVDVTDKDVTFRVATAEGEVNMQPETLRLIVDGKHAKGDVMAVARIAGIQAAKTRTRGIPIKAATSIHCLAVATSFSSSAKGLPKLELTPI